ncbi:hypothetical protein AN640_07985 [Candidatus Epulonipiscium fishelsonii]|uniref:Uncharacterized protein n=1 Tax=Candidatus Epulonipiscium fishelsonii TaxID=77094 RepID=A0ACC8XEE4_9FIRM|nr:hypothetical protein AN640_07985 [Epulopiscium sp. SCG-D08WGA-EpuloA1]OON98198.1 MAG: hypothetical protein ATN32_04790 [Epulopiscium sp. AS2M-Bin002]
MSRNLYEDRDIKNINGLKFEQDIDVQTAILEIKGYSIRNKNILMHNNNEVALILDRNSLYTRFFDPFEVNYKNIISKKLLPDGAIYVISTQTLHIIEKQFQKTVNVNDRELQSCDFKIKQYQKLIDTLNKKNDYMAKLTYNYILSDWFRRDEYIDVLTYIKDANCDYYFNELPLEVLNLPI